MDRSELAAAIYTTSHLVGAFQLRSGRTASEYFDKYRFDGSARRTGPSPLSVEVGSSS